MALKPGIISNNPNDFTNSMAKAMEDALRYHWPRVMGDRAIPVDRRHLNLLFVAIAQGVVRHLVENHASFRVGVTDVGERGHVDEIQHTSVKPPPEITGP